VFPYERLDPDLASRLKPQGRFKHMFAPGNEALLTKFQKLVDDDWESLKKLQEMSKS
jgi:hypothetical protein